MLPNSCGGHTAFRTIQHTETHLHTLYDICIISASWIYNTVKVIGQDDVRKQIEFGAVPHIPESFFEQIDILYENIASLVGHTCNKTGILQIAVPS